VPLLFGQFRPFGAVLRPDAGRTAPRSLCTKRVSRRALPFQFSASGTPNFAATAAAAAITGFEVAQNIVAVFEIFYLKVFRL